MVEYDGEGKAVYCRICGQDCFTETRLAAPEEFQEQVWGLAIAQSLRVSYSCKRGQRRCEITIVGYLAGTSTDEAVLEDIGFNFRPNLTLMTDPS
jgi:hypothetical protein